MGFVANIGKYQLGKTIGEGTFAKVKVAVNVENCENVAIKIIDKQMVISNRLMDQVAVKISAFSFFFWFSFLVIVILLYDYQCSFVPCTILDVAQVV